VVAQKEGAWLESACPLGRIQDRKINRVQQPDCGLRFAQLCALLQAQHQTSKKIVRPGASRAFSFFFRFTFLT
jgi:hypothetical protein